MRKKLSDLIYYFTPLNNEHRDILSTAVVFILFWVSVYTLSYITNL
jgi:hypothetical protein